MNLETDAHRHARPAAPGRRSPISLRRTAALAVGAAVVLAAAGCGGGSNGTTTKASTAPPAPTKAEYLAKANAICTATNGPLAATALKLASHPSPAEAEHIISSAFIPEIKSQLSQIQAIGTPAGGQTTVATMDRLLSGDIAKIEKDPALAGPAAFHDFAQVAHGYGLTACAPLS
ncbi:MAG TPA: hypothetical protein VMI13_14060 [Solirubrobacteraceae bacterium]|nr:hypothetical protein [Solirubrobacteraceae bacterium]